MTGKLKFWYSETHFASPTAARQTAWCWCVNVEGKRYLSTAISGLDAEEPFWGALEKFPDYRVVCVADWSATQEIAEADIPTIREQTIALCSEIVTSRVDSTKPEGPRGEESAAELLEKLKKIEQGELPGWLSFVLLAALAYGGWWWIQKSVLAPAGWVSHTVQSTITAQSNWMVGESKNCMSIPLNAQIASALGKKPGYAFFYVKCDDGPERKIQVTFWGQENQPRKRVAYWNCTRTADSFTCKQTGADAQPMLTHATGVAVFDGSLTVAPVTGGSNEKLSSEYRFSGYIKNTSASIIRSMVKMKIRIFTCSEIGSDNSQETEIEGNMVNTGTYDPNASQHCKAMGEDEEDVYLDDLSPGDTVGFGNFYFPERPANGFRWNYEIESER